MQQCRHCTLRTYVSRTSIIVLCWIRSIDCIGQDQLESSHSTFWIRFWIAQLDHDWIPRLIYDGHQLVSPVQSSSFRRILISDLISEVHTFFENPSLIVSEKKEYWIFSKNFFFQTSKVLRILKMLKIILKIQQEVVNICISPPICLKWHAAEKTQATFEKSLG